LAYLLEDPERLYINWYIASNQITLNMSQKLVVTTFKGLEQALLEEVKSLGLKDVVIINRGVSGYGDLSTVYRLNYGCRLGLQVLVMLSECTVNTAEDLYNSVLDIPWESLFDAGKSFAVKANINHNDAFDNSMFVALKTKDAIADRFRKTSGKRPNVDKDDPDVSVYVHIFRTECSIFLNASGTPLYVRGYRMQTGPAPLNEVLAAGILSLTGWDSKQPLLDLMCGSGTFLTEAALISRGIAPAFMRKKFAFLHWLNKDYALWESVKQEWETSHNMVHQPDLCGIDKDLSVIRKARQNIEHAGLKNYIRLFCSDFQSYQYNSPGGFIICNPPYGERMQDDEILTLYKSLGDTLKKNFQGSDAWIFSGSPEGFKSIGLKHSASIELFNGGIECRLRKYSLYQGSKKTRAEHV
jgi:putative N6-adenine-specific DNA methylase